MGISARELRKQLSPDVAALSAAALAELDRPGVDPLTLERNAGALGVEVGAPQPAAQSIVLPVPPSANDYWSWSEVGVHVTTKARLYKREVKQLAEWHGFKPFEGSVAVYVHVFRPAKRGDLDNYHKVLLDALKGVAYADDDQVVEIHAYRHDDKRNPRVEVEIRSTKGAR